jgi:hypothetical protein
MAGQRKKVPSEQARETESLSQNGLSQDGYGAGEGTNVSSEGFQKFTPNVSLLYPLRANFNLSSSNSKKLACSKTV